MAAELLSLSQLENSDVFISERAAFNFSHPLDYLRPFFDLLEPLGASFTFEGEVGSQSKERADESKSEQEKHIAYKRLIAKAKLPEAFNIIAGTDSTHDDLWSEIGFVYALDTQQPEMRVYKGKRVSVCTNQCVFGADNVTSINLAKSSTKPAYDSLKFYVDSAGEDLTKYKDTIQRLHSRTRSGNDLERQIGHMMLEAKRNSKLGITCVTDAVSYILDPKTKYALTPDGVTTDWMLYNACTESLKKSNILDEASKTVLLEKIFNLN